jgi:hypothetical protein
VSSRPSTVALTSESRVEVVRHSIKAVLRRDDAVLAWEAVRLERREIAIADEVLSEGAAEHGSRWVSAMTRWNIGMARKLLQVRRAVGIVGKDKAETSSRVLSM